MIHIHSKNFSILQFVFWAGVACYNPYLVIFLSNRGVSSTHIGILLMINSIITVLSQPLWGMISDRIHSIKKVFGFCIVLTAILVAALPLLPSNGAVTVMLPFIALMQSPLVPLLETWTLKSVQTGSSKSYGAIRLWGSIGFATIVIIMGIVVSKLSAGFAFMCYGIVNSMTIILCFMLKDIERQSSENGLVRETKRAGMPVGKLFRNPRYITILLLMCMIYIVVSPMFSFLPKLMLYAGGTTNVYGIAMAASAFSEVPVLFLSGTLIRKFKPLHMILLAAFFYMIRMVILSTFVTPAGIIFAQCFQGLSYAFLLPGSIHYIDSLAPEGLASTAQSAAIAVYSGLGGMIGNSVGGSLIDRIGIITAYRYGAAFLVAVFLLFTAYVLLDHKANLTAEPREQ